MFEIGRNTVWGRQDGFGSQWTRRNCHPDCDRSLGSQRTHRWRNPDSNRRSRPVRSERLIRRRFHNEFAPDSALEGAVRCELVSKGSWVR
jgi:hypothetical protein